jgi:hypothetical protein
MRTYLTALMLMATLGLASCGGGNDGASTGTPVVAQATLCTAPACPSPPNPWTVYSNGGCGNTSTYGWGNTGPSLTPAQLNACNTALNNVSNIQQNIQQCTALGGYATGNYYSGTCSWLWNNGTVIEWSNSPDIPPG